MAVDERGALWVPVATVMPLHISRLGKMSTMMVENKKIAQDLSYRLGGRAQKPPGIVTMPAADGQTPIMIAGLGECEAAEMEDIALEALEKSEEQMQKTGASIDFASERERRGYEPVETFDTRYREYLHERAEYGKRNIRTALTQPFAEHVHEHGLGRGQSMVTVPANPVKEQQSSGS